MKQRLFLASHFFTYLCSLFSIKQQLIVEQVTLYVSAETGTYQNVPDNNYVEGMLIREQGESAFYCVSFQEISGFTYERGHEYELFVKRTTLANPPQDSGKYRYELVRIVSDRKVE